MNDQESLKTEGVIVELPWPPQVNNLLSVVRGRKILSKKARQFYKDAVASILEQGQQNLRLSGSIRMRMLLKAPNRRSYDISNRVKAAEDALVKAGVIDDDSSVDFLAVYRGDPIEGGKVICNISRRDKVKHEA